MAWKRRAVLVLSALGLVHGALLLPVEAQSQAAKAKTQSQRNKASAADRRAGDIPGPVLEMREAILSAVRSGSIEDLRFAIELNEIKPDVGAPRGVDPIAHLKSISTDGRGIDVLAVLGLILETSPAVVRAGADIENNAIYVWPDLSEAKLDTLTPAQEVTLTRLAGPQQARALIAAKTWTWWRLAIGADGTWHGFSR